MKRRVEVPRRTLRSGAARSVPTPPNAVERRFSWTVLLGAIATTIAIGTAFLAATGAMAHSKYLTLVGLDRSMFPKSTDWLVLTGYYATLNQSFSFARYASANLWTVLGVASLLFAYIFGLLAIGRLSSRDDPPRAFEKVKPYVRRIVAGTIASVLLAAMVPAAAWGITVVLAFAGWIGELAGKDYHASYLKSLDMSCIYGAKAQCIEVWRSEKLLACGVQVDSSQSLIAVAGPLDGKPRIIPMEGVEVHAASSCLSKLVGPPAPN